MPLKDISKAFKRPPDTLNILNYCMILPNKKTFAEPLGLQRALDPPKRHHPGFVPLFLPRRFPQEKKRSLALSFQINAIASRAFGPQRLPKHLQESRFQDLSSFPPDPCGPVFSAKQLAKDLEFLRYSNKPSKSLAAKDLPWASNCLRGLPKDS